MNPSPFNRLPTDPEKRRNALEARRAFVARTGSTLHCPSHGNYVGFKGLFPCHDCAEEATR